MKKYLSLIILTFVVFLLWIIFSLYLSTIKIPSIPGVGGGALGNFNSDLYLNNLSTVENNAKYVCVNSNFTSQPCDNQTLY
jgi:hypothetical protein